MPPMPSEELTMTFTEKIKAIRDEAFTEMGIHGSTIKIGAAAAVGTIATVAPAMAATTIIDPNIIDFTNLSTMIGNVAGIIPGIVTLVVSTVPLFIVNGVVYLIMGIFAGVIAMFTFK